MNPIGLLGLAFFAVVAWYWDKKSPEEKRRSSGSNTSAFVIFETLQTLGLLKRADAL